MSVGVFLARMQPLHNAHLFLVKEACKDNDEVIVMLGSSNKKDMLRNPFSLEIRTSLLLIAIRNDMGMEYANKIKVYDLPDWSQENDIVNQKEWGSYLYYNIVSRANTKKFTMYFSDDPAIMKGWFNEQLLDRISFKFYERNKLFDGLSATKIREAFMTDNVEYIIKHCPDTVYMSYSGLRDIWLEVNKNPKNDFSMI